MMLHESCLYLALAKNTQKHAFFTLKLTGLVAQSPKGSFDTVEFSSLSDSYVAGRYT